MKQLFESKLTLLTNVEHLNLNIKEINVYNSSCLVSDKTDNYI